MSRKRTRVPGHGLLDHVQKIVSQGGVRRVCIMDEQKSLLEVPLDVGDPMAPASVLKAPVIAAIKAFGTLMNECIVEVEDAEGRLP